MDVIIITEPTYVKKNSKKLLKQISVLHNTGYTIYTLPHSGLAIKSCLELGILPLFFHPRDMLDMKELKVLFYTRNCVLLELLGYYDLSSKMERLKLKEDGARIEKDKQKIDMDHAHLKEFKGKKYNKLDRKRYLQSKNMVEPRWEKKNDKYLEDDLIQAVEYIKDICWGHGVPFETITDF